MTPHPTESDVLRQARDALAFYAGAAHDGYGQPIGATASDVLAAIDALPSAPGWQFVPIEPTPEMLAVDVDPGVCVTIEAARIMWAAMLAVAPSWPSSAPAVVATELMRALPQASALPERGPSGMVFPPPGGPATDIDEAQLACLHERGAAAWAGMDAQVLREGEASGEPFAHVLVIDGAGGPVRRFCAASTPGAIAVYTHGSAPSGEPADTLCQQLQQRCVDWGVYWRASDAHGVDLSHEQAIELLRDALGVEVAIAAPLLSNGLTETSATASVAGPWYEGPPLFPQDQEWFIAETTYGDRVVLKSFDKGQEHKGNYAFKTADETYLKAELVKRWMQFPDCEYLPPDGAAPQTAAVPAPSDCLWARNGNAPCQASPAAAAPEPEPLPLEMIISACYSYRHDFGLLPDAERAALVDQAREWERALGKERAISATVPTVRGLTDGQRAAYERVREEFILVQKAGRAACIPSAMLNVDALLRAHGIATPAAAKE